MKRKTYTGDEGIVAYGKISEAVSKIYDDKELMKKFETSQMAAISEIMKKHKEEVSTILFLSIDGEIEFENIGIYFLRLFTEYFKKFNELKNDDFFKTAVETTE